MSKNRLLIASIALVALAAVALFKSSTRDAENTPKAVAEVELPKLKSEDIDELELSSPDKTRVRLVKKDGAWRLTEPLDAKADDNAASTAVTKLAELELTGVAATKAKNHEKLEVDAAHGTHVIARAAGKTLLDGYIGAYRSGSSMFRLEGQESVATVKGSIRYAFSKAVREWRDRQISDVPTDSVKAMTFTNGKGQLRFEREGEDWKQVVAKGQKPITPLDQSKVKGVLGTAASLNATDFADAAASPAQTGLANPQGVVKLEVGGESPREIVYRIGAQRDQSYFLQMDGNDTVYLVSSWIGGRLLTSAETLVKKPEEAREGSRENPIQVMPSEVRPGMAPGGMPMQMPPGHP